MTTIDHTCIHVLDLDRSAAFYRNALGLTPVRSLDCPTGAGSSSSWGTAPRTSSWSCAGK